MLFAWRANGTAVGRTMLLWIFSRCLFSSLADSHMKHDQEDSLGENPTAERRIFESALLNGAVEVYSRYLNGSLQSAIVDDRYTHRQAKNKYNDFWEGWKKMDITGIFGTRSRGIEIQLGHIHQREDSRSILRANFDVLLLDRAANEYASYLSHEQDTKRIESRGFRKIQERVREFAGTFWRAMKNLSSSVDMTKCYETYGCFSISYPWSSLKRPVTLFPESPAKVNPQYCLYTRRNPTECHRLRLGDPVSIGRSNLNAEHMSYFISHGYLETAEKPWVQKMVAELLKKSDVNVVTVDWLGGSGPTYTQAVSNIRLVGVMTAHLIKLMKEKSGVNPEKIHLIGHSLGSHLSGYIGLKMKEFGARIGRITGMDPADPQFDGMETIVRLDPSDAIFVDIIHTDTRPFVSGGFGLAAPIGHIDFYPNGGEYQPGCNKGFMTYISQEKGSIIGGIRHYVGCNHIRSYEYFTESINSECPFAAIECSSYEKFLAGECFACSANGIHPNKVDRYTNLIEDGTTNQTLCSKMGFHAADPFMNGDIPTTPPRELVKLYLITGPGSPYCRHHYRITLKISGSAKSRAHNGEFGTFWLTLRGEKASYSGRLRVNPRDKYFEPGTTHTWLVSGMPVGRFTSAKIEWVFGTSVFNPLLWRLLTIPSIHLSWLKVEVLETEERMTMCAEGEPLKTKTPRHFTADDNAPCPPPKGGSVSWGFMGVRTEDSDEESGEATGLAVKEEESARGDSGEMEEEDYEEEEEVEEEKAKEKDEKKNKTKGWSFFSFG